MQEILTPIEEKYPELLKILKWWEKNSKGRKARIETVISLYKSQLFKGVGRNDLCPCGSGKKFKKCHGGN